MTTWAPGGLYLSGGWRNQESRQCIELVNPATERVFGQVIEATVADAEDAVSAARLALPTWSALDRTTRVSLLWRLREELDSRQEELARAISTDVGTPIGLSRTGQVGLPIAMLDGFVAAAEQIEWRRQLGRTLVVREPVGVVAAITPWNFPLQQAIGKIGAALAAGCTVVLKPSELAPWAGVLLADAVDRVGLPPGVFNLVNGYGPGVGESLVTHPDVAMVSFTGSTVVGRRIAAAAAGTVKKVALELGGKSPSIVLPGADVAEAAAATAIRCFNNSGQTCAALTRLLVPRDHLEAAEQAAADVANGQVLGDPLDEATTQGPLVSSRQREAVLRYVDSGIAEGARLVAGGPAARVPARGYFVAPTVFTEVSPVMTIAREEIFGPVLSIIAYDSVDEAIAIANDSPFGLNASVWSGTSAEAASVAAQLRCGQVNVNGGRPNPAAPFGGYKQSGVGRENGRDGIVEFLETKAVNFGSDDLAWPVA